MAWEVRALAPSEAHLAAALLEERGAPGASPEQLAALLRSPLTVCVAAIEQGEILAALLATRVPQLSSGGEMVCIDAFLVRQFVLGQALLAALTEHARQWRCRMLFMPHTPDDLGYLLQSLGAVRAHGAWIWWVAPAR